MGHPPVTGHSQYFRFRNLGENLHQGLIHKTEAECQYLALIGNPRPSGAWTGHPRAAKKTLVTNDPG